VVENERELNSKKDDLAVTRAGGYWGRGGTGLSKGERDVRLRRNSRKDNGKNFVSGGKRSYFKKKPAEGGGEEGHISPQKEEY